MSALPAALATLAETSPALSDLLRAAARAAATESTVLILGEPGSGRSTLARALHAVSARGEGPLHEVDAGAVPASLFESELFGHTAGAFTGADSASAGRLARASGGSLLIDRVEEIPRRVQPKLLRLLSENRYAPLGGEERHADVRFLAVGAVDLPERVARGVFRRDLYHRLEILTLRLPALRERRDDLERLAAALLADLGERLGRDRLSLSTAASRWMRAYDWPGNLREMRNVLERELLMTEGRVLDPPRPTGAAAGAPLPLAAVEKEEIRRALAHTRGHQGRAAELLGISRKALWQKRKRHGLP